MIQNQLENGVNTLATRGYRDFHVVKLTRGGRLLSRRKRMINVIERTNRIHKISNTQCIVVNNAS